MAAQINPSPTERFHQQHVWALHDATSKFVENRLASFSAVFSVWLVLAASFAAAITGGEILLVVEHAEMNTISATLKEFRMRFMSSSKDFRFIAPTGFKGPATISKSKYSRLVAFSSTRENGTVITVHSGYSKTPLWDPSPEMQRSVVGKYLTKMISGIENRRTNYEQDDIEFFEISGIQVGKASWTGDTDKGSMQGTMYSFLKSGNNHTFAVQGFSHNTSSLNKAYDAVENLRIRN